MGNVKLQESLHPKLLIQLDNVHIWLYIILLSLFHTLMNVLQLLRPQNLMPMLLHLQKLDSRAIHSLYVLILHQSLCRLLQL